MAYPRQNAQTVAIESQLPATVLFAAAADMTAIAQWWYLNPPSDQPDSSERQHATRHTTDAAGLGLVAREGATADIESTGAWSLALNRKLITERPSVIRFTCETAVEGLRVRYTHELRSGHHANSKTASEIRVQNHAAVRRLTLTQETFASVRGPLGLVQRWAHAELDRLTRVAAERIVEIAKQRHEA